MENDKKKENVFVKAVKAVKSVLKKAWAAVRRFFYDVSVALYHKTHKKPRKTRSYSARKRSEILFLICLLAYPILIFLVGYVYVNVNSVLLTFQTYDIDKGVFYWSGFENIKKVLSDIVSDPVISPMFGRSLSSYAIRMLIGFPLNIIFAYVIYKKIPLAGLFQIVLFLPSIISSMVVTLMFKNFVDYIVPAVFSAFGMKNPPNLLFDYQTAFGMQNFYTIWVGFGSQLILYSGAMSRIPDSIVEFGELEGITMFKEFWHVTIPMIWQTITIFLVTGVATIFTGQLALFNFYGTNAPTEIQTIGYYFFQRVVGDTATYADYPYAAAGGLLFTLVAAPVTLLARWLLEKFGPNVEF